MQVLPLRYAPDDKAWLLVELMFMGGQGSRSTIRHVAMPPYAVPGANYLMLGCLWLEARAFSRRNGPVHRIFALHLQVI